MTFYQVPSSMLHSHRKQIIFLFEPDQTLPMRVNQANGLAFFLSVSASITDFDHRGPGHEPRPPGC